MSTARGGRELPVSEEQLTRLTRETDEAHRATLPVMRRSAAGLAERLRDEERERAARPGRRTFLLGATGVGAAFALAACSGGANSASAPAGIDVAGDVASKAGYSGDLRLVALSVALENQAVGAYKATLAAAKAGRLGTVPPAVSTFVSTAMAQHADHAETWNSVLTGAGKPAVTDVPLSNQKEVTAALGRATSVSDAAELVLTLEDQAAQTTCTRCPTCGARPGSRRRPPSRPSRRCTRRSCASSSGGTRCRTRSCRSARPRSPAC
ncbi:ferritin-like domain-containing protein [Streptomyces griseoviridis]|uniref:ferritin-like domain-containing protein n=1 Tax=Streptomyces griseoviridis TaxID=45398 RepID=UPI00344F8FC4